MHLVCNCCSNGNPLTRADLQAVYSPSIPEGAIRTGRWCKLLTESLRTTWAGGHGYGVVFVIDSEQLLHCTVSNPVTAPSRRSLVQASNGNFYEQLTVEGQRPGHSFEITSTGAITTLYSFSFHGPTVGRAGAGHGREL